MFQIPMAAVAAALSAAAGDPGAPLVLALDELAAKAFDRHLARLHVLLRDSAGSETAWLGKGRGMVARLAAALTLLNWAVTFRT